MSQEEHYKKKPPQLFQNHSSCNRSFHFFRIHDFSVSMSKSRKLLKMNLNQTHYLVNKVLGKGKMGKIILGTATSAKPYYTEVKLFQKGNTVRLLRAL